MNAFNLIYLANIALVLIASLKVSLGQAEDDGVIVQISTGLIRGRTIPMHYDGSSEYKTAVNSFYGIPFGKPPIGELRFERPEPAEPWDDILNATTTGTLPNMCMQSPGSVMRYTHPWYTNYDEDCLNLNVFSPVDMSPDTPYPVMVYFFGGAFAAGGNIQYPGHFYAARDVIAVVVNYRIGIFGFMHTEPGTTPSLGNAGLFDQALSLEWIQENIAAFGGDPNQVVISGQSAGAASSGIHVISPFSQGLFHGVIEQSGCDTNFWSINEPAQEPWNYPKQVAEKVACPTDDTQAMVDCMRSLNASYLLDNQGFTCEPGYFCLGHAPVIDGEGGFIPDNPLRIREAGNFAKVPIFGGHNAEDGSLYVVAYIPEALEGGFNRSEFQYLLYDRYVKIWEDSVTPEQAEDAYWAVDFYYTPWPHIEDEEANRQAFNDMTTDAAFGYPVDRQLKLQSEYAPTYMYIFGYRSTNTSDGVFEDTEWAGVPHSGEIPYTYGWGLLKNATEVRRDQKMFFDIVQWNAVDEEYAEFTLDLWSNFVKYFNPTPDPVQAPIGHGPITLPALTQDELNYIWIHIDDVEARVNYRQRDYAFFRDYMSYIIDREIYTEEELPKVAPRSNLGINTEYLEMVREKMANELMQNAFLYNQDDLSEEEEDVMKMMSLDSMNFDSSSRKKVEMFTEYPNRNN